MPNKSADKQYNLYVVSGYKPVNVITAWSGAFSTNIVDSPRFIICEIELINNFGETAAQVTLPGLEIFT